MRYGLGVGEGVSTVLRRVYQASLNGLFWALALALALAGCERSAQTPALPSASPPAPRVSNALLPTPTASPSPAPTPSPSPQGFDTPTAPPGADAADLAAIQRFEQDGASLVETSALLQVYRADALQRRYQSTRWTYLLDPLSHQILQIQPVEETAAAEGSPLAPAQLEQAARDLIAKIAPQVNLAELIPAHTSASGNFLFRWEDHRLALLEDGRSYPFIQVASNASAGLLTYLNTLPLGKAGR